MARNNYRITPEDFVVAWQQSSSSAEAAERLAKKAGRPVPRSVVLARATYYRRAGVQLKFMGRGPSRLRVAELNRLLA